METRHDLADTNVNSNSYYWKYWDWCFNHHTRFEAILENGYRSDVTFIVGKEQKEIKAHKLILCIGSPVFSKMFDVQTKVYNSYMISEFQPKEFLLFLKVK